MFPTTGAEAKSGGIVGKSKSTESGFQDRVFLALDGTVITGRRASGSI